MSVLRFVEETPLDVFNAYRVAWSGDDADTIWENAMKKGVITRIRKNAPLPAQHPSAEETERIKRLNYWHKTIDERYAKTIDPQRLQRIHMTLPRFFACFPQFDDWSVNNVHFSAEVENRIEIEVGYMNSVFRHVRQATRHSFGRCFINIGDCCTAAKPNESTRNLTQYASVWVNDKDNLSLIGRAISMFIYAGGNLEHFDDMLAVVAAKVKAASP